MKWRPVPKGATFLGIDGGATRSVALLVDADGAVLKRATAGPANLKLVSDIKLVSLLRSFAASMARPDHIAIGLAGAWTERDKRRVQAACGRVWRGIPCYATHDLETAYACGAPRERGPKLQQVLVVSGTGSACYAQKHTGEEVKVGGWGHLLGDHGSGYAIGLKALQTVVEEYDRSGRWPRLGRQILRALLLNEPYDLIPWVQAATKPAIADLAVEVFRARARNDRIARQILVHAAKDLAIGATTCARRVVAGGETVHFSLAGSVLLRQPGFAQQVGRAIRRLWPNAIVRPLRRESAWGAVDLARAKAKVRPVQWEVVAAKTAEANSAPPPSVRSRSLPPTERRHPRSMQLDQLPLTDAIRLFLSEDSRLPRKLVSLGPKIKQVVEALVRAFRQGGRLFYVGAGTSGRLGVLDASECPPTFGTSPDLVQGIIAGGQSALWKSVEGAEDDFQAGRSAIEFRAVNRRDVVVGIAASGTTPFVWGALQAAKTRGATTILLCFNPALTIPRVLRPRLVLAPDLGPELLTGSTRLKAGTATKLLLNLFTTLTMVRLGKVRSNLMIDLDPGNTKLRQRAVRIVRALTAADEAQARSVLQSSGWRIKDAIADLAPK